MKNLNHYIDIYKQQLDKGDILIAYNQLVKFVMKLRVDLINSQSERYTFTSILHGYMDYTYFYFSNEFLKRKKLKLGLVLNHSEMRFELWLLGNTKAVQKEYWHLLKSTKWNKDRNEMPKYSILEVVIDDKPDFDHLPALAKKIEDKMIETSVEVIKTIKKLH